MEMCLHQLKIMAIEKEKFGGGRGDFISMVT